MKQRIFTSDGRVCLNFARYFSKALAHLFLTHLPDYRQFYLCVKRYGQASEIEFALQSKDFSKIIDSQI